MITLCARDGEAASSRSAQLRRCQKGAQIYSQGELATCWYSVLRGIVRTCRYHADGHRQLTGFYYEGDVFGLDGGIYQETAEAVTTVTLERRKAFRSPPVTSEDASEASEIPLQRALTRARECIFLLGHRTAAQRVAAFFLAIAERLPAQGCLQLAMTRSDIADYLGLTVHTVSRTISELVRRKLVVLEGPQRVRLIDVAGLRDLAGEAGGDLSAPIASRQSDEDHYAAA